MKNRKITKYIAVLLLAMMFTSVPISAQTYTYDPLGRVTSITYDDGYKETYTYDAGGNIISTVVDDRGVIKVSLNGKPLTFDPLPMIQNGVTMIPLRTIFEAMGATVSWNQATQTVTAKIDSTTVMVQINNKSITVNGKSVVLDAAPTLVNERTFVPAGAVADGLNANVIWNKETNTVVITK